MTSVTFYQGIDVKGVVKASNGRMIGIVDTMPVAAKALSGVAVLYTGAGGSHTAGAIYRCDPSSGGYAWVRVDDHISVDASLSATSTNPVQNKAVKSGFDSLEKAIAEKIDAISAEGVAVSWTADASVSGYSYKGTIALQGVTSEYMPFVTFSAVQASSGNFCPVAESGTNAIYIWSKTNDAVTVPSVAAAKM